MTANHKLKIGAILLAAGGSSRLGEPKQLLEFEGKTLIRRAAEMLAASVCSPVVVVLGAEVERSTSEVSGSGVSLCVNQDWKQGMSTSIRSGINSALDIEPELDAIAIALCDQPFVQAKDIDRLTDEFTVSKKPVVGSEYDGIIGVPALFARQMFSELLLLEGDQGARKVMQKKPELVSAVEIPSAAVDIDTLEDSLELARFGNKYSSSEE